MAIERPSHHRNHLHHQHHITSIIIDRTIEATREAGCCNLFAFLFAHLHYHIFISILSILVWWTAVEEGKVSRTNTQTQSRGVLLSYGGVGVTINTAVCVRWCTCGVCGVWYGVGIYPITPNMGNLLRGESKTPLTHISHSFARCMVTLINQSFLKHSATNRSIDSSCCIRALSLFFSLSYSWLLECQRLSCCTDYIRLCVCIIINAKCGMCTWTSSHSMTLSLSLSLFKMWKC